MIPELLVHVFTFNPSISLWNEMDEKSREVILKWVYTRYPTLKDFLFSNNLELAESIHSTYPLDITDVDIAFIAFEKTDRIKFRNTCLSLPLWSISRLTALFELYREDLEDNRDRFDDMFIDTVTNSDEETLALLISLGILEKYISFNVLQDAKNIIMQNNDLKLLPMLKKEVPYIFS